MDLVLTRGEGVQNPKKLTDITCVRPLMSVNASINDSVNELNETQKN